MSTIRRPPPLHPYWQTHFATYEDDRPTTPTGELVIPVGARDDTLASIAGSLRRLGLTEAVIRTSLQAINDHQTETSLDPRDINRIARSISRYAPGHPQLLTYITTGGLDTNTNTDPDSDVYQLYADDQIDNLPDPTWLVHNTLPTNALTVEYGPSGAYKSFDAISLGLGIATGTHWNQKHCRQGPVIYVLAEGRSGAKKRIRAWKKHHGIDKAPDFHLLPQAVPLTDPLALAKIIRTAQALPEPPVLIIIDTLARSMPGSHENDTKDVSALIAAIDHLRDQLGCGIHLIHHTGHDTSRERGNTALRGAADTMIRLTKDAGGIVTAKCDKQKDADEGPLEHYRFEEVLLTDSGVLVPSEAPEREEGEPTKASASQIAAWIVSQPNHRATTSAICHEFDITRGTLINRRHELKRNGIEHIGDGPRSRYVAASPAYTSGRLDEDNEALKELA